MSCDVFISYRREDGAHVSYWLWDDLFKAGYDVFYDRHNLWSGEFPTLIEENIRSCTDFVLVVTKSTFGERILNEDDWVRREIRTALECGKNIVPLFFGTASFPHKTELPEDIARVVDFNGEAHNDPQAFREINERVCRRFLKSPRIINNSEHKTKVQTTIYDASYGEESARLRIQAQNAYQSDMDALSHHLTADAIYTVLDIGCAYGDVGKSRFSDSRFSQVVGIDQNETCVAQAQSNNVDPRFSYYVMDVETEEFEQNLQTVMAEKGIDGFDVIYMALVVHHLKDAHKFLKRVKKFLSANGIVMVRGSDDGSKLAYGDSGMVEKIIRLTMEVPHVSDRYNGRKIYSQLTKAGFKDVTIYSYMRDTSRMDSEAREFLFTESFSYRSNYTKRYYKEDPTKPSREQKMLEMEELLEQLEERFYDTSTFWYCEYDYIGIAHK